MPDTTPGRRPGRLRLGILLLAGALLATACGGPSGPSTSGVPAVRVVAVGDIACEPGGRVSPTTCQQAATAELTASLAPDAVIALGDLQYETGAAQAFDRSFDSSWGALRDLTRALPGNHEYGTPGAAGFYGSVDATRPWYAWDAGGWRVYMLNSNCSRVDCAAERAWLEADLAQNPRPCSAIAMHHPRYSSGQHHSTESMAGFWQIAYDHRVDLALAGHDHDYERFAPMDARRRVVPGRGITSFVAGTGGRSLYRKRAHETGSQYFQAESFGVLDLELRPNELAWRFVGLDRRVLDEGTTACV